MIWNKVRERLRSRAVGRLQAAGSDAEPGLERLTEQAAQAFAARVALLTLVRDDQLWVCASTGFDLRCAPRGQSFCSHLLDTGLILEVCDTLAHPLFRTLPMVMASPAIRYYIGAPLTMASGVDVGALCILAHQPRPPASADQRAYLTGLARQAAAALDRRAYRQRQAA